MSYPLIILGGGLSGLAAGIRYARFGNRVLILEKHSKVGGLNSYYHRRGMLFETGLHSITNYAPPNVRHAPLNRLFRQLKFSRQEFACHQQVGSEIFFGRQGSLQFSNDFSQLTEEIHRLFPTRIDRFRNFVKYMNTLDPLVPQPWISTRQQLAAALDHELLADFLLCPLMFYGSSQERDMDFSQFVILFRAVFQEGLFRLAGTIKDFLDFLVARYQACGGEIRLSSGVATLLEHPDKRNRIAGVRLASGEEIEGEHILSTIGYPETLNLLETAAGRRPDRGRDKGPAEVSRRLSFVESIYILPAEVKNRLKQGRTIIFYNLADRFNYERPAEAVDLRSGIICFPDNFQGLTVKDTFQLRTTHLANYNCWKNGFLSEKPDEYTEMKAHWSRMTRESVGKIIGNFAENIVYEDTFTPVTIERFTSKLHGAVYGSPIKIKNGKTSYENLFIGGTDQGFLGIVGAMLSGVTVVNQHILKAS